MYERDLKVQTVKARRLGLLFTLARVVSEQLEDPVRAMKVCEQALEVDPSHAGALEALSGLRKQSGYAQAAIRTRSTSHSKSIPLGVPKPFFRHPPSDSCALCASADPPHRRKNDDFAFALLFFNDLLDFLRARSNNVPRLEDLAVPESRGFNPGRKCDE